MKRTGLVLMLWIIFAAVIKGYADISISLLVMLCVIFFIGSILYTFGKE